MIFRKEKESKKISDPFVSHITADTTIEGDIHCEHELLVSGTVKGNIFCDKKLVIAQTGKVIGNICGNSIIVSGGIEGNIESSGLLIIESTAVIQADITCSSIEVHAGARIDSKVHVSMNNNIQACSKTSE